MGHKTGKRPLNPKVLYIIAAIVCVILVIVSYIFSDKFEPIKNAVSNCFAPMQKGIDTLGNKITKRVTLLTDMQKLIDENEQLKQELEDVKSENQILSQEKYELSIYRDLYDMDSIYMDSKKVAARVISRDPNSYIREFIIDKGEDDGIQVNMNVVSGNGLVGIITEVGKNWSKVRTIIDDKSSVSGMFLTTSDKCIVNGNAELFDKGYLGVEMISIDADVYDNYEIVTSYISQNYLPGILIGYVSDITKDLNTMSMNAHLTPAVDFEHIDAVLVITTLRESMEGYDE